MPPQQPHFPQPNEPAPNETPTSAPVSPSASHTAPGLPPLPPLDESPINVPARAATRPPLRRAARLTRPIQPPTLPGLEDDIRAADAEVRAEVHSRALVPAATHMAIAPNRGGGGGESPALLIRGAARAPRPAARVVPRRSGPRSFLMQFLVAMLASVALVGALALTTPLGQNIAAATNAGNDPGKQAVINDIIAVFGSSYAQGALNIAKCESGYDPNARNSYPIGNSHASGVFQILYPSTWNTTSYAAYSPFEYDKNIRAAYEIFRRDGYSWREWACKPY